MGEIRPLNCKFRGISLEKYRASVNAELARKFPGRMTVAMIL
jgi:hypothetical protein